VVAEQECRRAAQRAEDAYRRAFNDGVVADEEALAREHEGALAAARRVFKDLAVGDKGTRTAHKLEMIRACDTRSGVNGAGGTGHRFSQDSIAGNGWLFPRVDPSHNTCWPSVAVGWKWAGSELQQQQSAVPVVLQVPAHPRAQAG
jgi:hypothetical protein